MGTTSDRSQGQAPLTIHFDASTSTDPQNLPLTYSWAFGDGSTATGAIVAGTFQNAGTYSATVAVGDGHNTTTSSPIVITVTPASTNPVPDARNSSTLFYVSPAVNPGRTILFQGQYLGAASQATVVRLADSTNPDPSTASFNFPTGADFTNGVLLPIIQASNTSAKLTLSSELNPGVYAVQFESSTNAGSQIAPSPIHAVINLPQVQWWMGRSTVPGSTGSAAYAGQEVDIIVDDKDISVLAVGDGLAVEGVEGVELVGSRVFVVLGERFRARSDIPADAAIPVSAGFLCDQPRVQRRCTGPEKD